jgi:hypothetical protein
MNFITSVDNVWARRASIVLIVLCAIPLLTIVIGAEVIWKTFKYMIVLVRTVIQETIPTVQSYIDQIKDNW